MACIRKLRGKYVVDYRDGAGIRRWVTCATRCEAEAVMDKVRGARQPTRPVVDPNITVNAYAERWLATIEATVKPRTRESYGKTLRLHILPAVGHMRMLPEAAMTKLGHSLLTTARVGALLPADVPEGRMWGVVVRRDGRWLGSDGDR